MIPDRKYYVGDMRILYRLYIDNYMNAHNHTVHSVDSYRLNDVTICAQIVSFPYRILLFLLNSPESDGKFTIL